MKQTFVSSYGVGAASTRTRVNEWVARLRLDADVYSYMGTSRLGADVLRGHAKRILPAEYRLRQLAARRRPHLFLQRQASPFGRGGIEQALLKSADFSVYDFDDALAWEPQAGLASRLLASRSGKWRTAVRVADRVIAGSEQLAEWASDYTKDVIVIPTCVEPLDYVVKTDYQLGDPPLLVWLGSGSTEAYLRQIAAPLLEINRRTGARLLLLSAGNADLGPLQPMVDRREWTLATYAAIVAKADIAISPMTDTPWSRGKCAYKMLQYGAMGLPIVASPVGANTVAADALGAVKASSATDWVEAALQLISADADLRRDMGQRARDAVIKHYSYAAWQTEWLAAQQPGDSAVS